MHTCVLVMERSFNVRLYDGVFFFTCVTVPPRISRSKMGRMVEVRKGTMVTLDCEAAGNPVPTIQWTRRVSLAFLCNFIARRGVYWYCARLIRIAKKKQLCTDFTIELYYVWCGKMECSLWYVKYEYKYRDVPAAVCNKCSVMQENIAFNLPRWWSLSFIVPIVNYRPRNV